MAWISNFAGKAETILNKLDQNAANALQVTTGASPQASAIEDEESSSLESMRRSISNSKLSLRAVSSPAKVNSIKSSYTMDVEQEAKILKTVGVVLSATEGSNENIGDNSSPHIASRTKSKNSSEDVAIDVEEVLLPKHSLESQELMAFKIALNEVTAERNDLRIRLSILSQKDEQIVLERKLQGMEALIQRLTDEYDQVQLELNNTRSTNSAYMQSISELETNLAKLQLEYMETINKLQIQIEETEQQRRELKEYRTKAQIALQMKDNIINELKTNSQTAQTSTREGESKVKQLQMELNALKEEHKNTLEDCATLRLQLEEFRRDLQSINEQHSKHASSARITEDELRKELRMERQRLLASESEHRVQAQELVKLRHQLSNHMAASATQLQEKEGQLQKLRSELLHRKANVKSEDGLVSYDFDERIEALTQTLVQKQQTVEQITTERNAFRIQLEKMQDQLQQQYAFNTNLQSGKQTARNELLSNTTDDVKAQFPLLMRENPFDNRVARRVKRAYSSLDSAGIRLGAFLRRYPLMRIFVLLYVGLLHLWVVFVLISSSPN